MRIWQYHNQKRKILIYSKKFNFQSPFFTIQPDNIPEDLKIKYFPSKF